jgi:hypothetical protein
MNRVNSGVGMADILDQARPNNARDGVTGCLTVVDGHFVQVLEGEPEKLDPLMERLRQDPRHTDVRVMERRGVQERAFPSWSMLSPLLAQGEIDQLRQLLLAPYGTLTDFIEPLIEAMKRQERAVRDFQEINERSSRDAPPLKTSAPD